MDNQGPNARLSVHEKVNNKKSQTIESTREIPEQLAVGLAVHQAIRSKEIVNMLQGFRMSVEYNRPLRVNRR